MGGPTHAADLRCSLDSVALSILAGRAIYDDTRKAPNILYPLLGGPKARLHFNIRTIHFPASKASKFGVISRRRLTSEMSGN